MADINPFSRVLQKHAGRAKERLLQNLGKADRTTDEDFDLNVKNFTKQQTAVLRLNKEFKNYYQCLRAMQAARRSLMDTVCELYEPCWDGVDQFLIKTEVSNKTFDDFCEKVNTELLTPVTCHLNQFPEIVNKISKRKRKLLDYDNCRHNLQNLETMKKREDTKISKAREQLEDAKNHFELINSELHEELPTLYESRVTFFASHLQCLFLTEADFHKQDGSISVEMSQVLENLNDAYKRGSFAERPKLENGTSNNESPEPKVMTENSLEKEKLQEDGSCGSANESQVYSTPPTTYERNVNPEMIAEITNVEISEKDENTENHVQTTNDQPQHNVLYQVKGTYKYAAEDGDELSFNVGDVIDVTTYDDPEEQEEGWLMGVFKGKKGLFPANFTSRI